MMSPASSTPSTPAIRLLRAQGVAFTERVYRYEEHGDMEVSTKQLARAIGCKTVEPCRPDVANRHSGYLVGGTSPFGTRKVWRPLTSRAC